MHLEDVHNKNNIVIFNLKTITVKVFYILGIVENCSREMMRLKIGSENIDYESELGRGNVFTQ
jgi:hypothetical protein